MRKVIAILFISLLIVALLVSMTSAQYQYPTRPTPRPYRQPTQGRPCIITESYYNCGGMVIGVSTPYATETPEITPTP